MVKIEKPATIVKTVKQILSDADLLERVPVRNSRIKRTITVDDVGTAVYIREKLIKRSNPTEEFIEDIINTVYTRIREAFPDNKIEEVEVFVKGTMNYTTRNVLVIHY